jgi:hypothetical protein
MLPIRMTWLRTVRKKLLSNSMATTMIRTKKLSIIRGRKDPGLTGSTRQTQ